MESKELLDSENITCPYCNSILVDHNEIGEYEVCDHTIFVATDHGFEFIRDDFQSTIDKNPIGNIDEYTSKLQIKGIRLSQYTPAPSVFGVYWGFVKD